MQGSSDTGIRGSQKLRLGHAVFDSDLFLVWRSEGFEALIGPCDTGDALPDIMPVFKGVEDTLMRMADSAQPDWYLPAVAHVRPGQQELRYLDVVTFVDQPGVAVTVFVWDVTTEMQVRGRLIQERNEMQLLNQRLSRGGMRNDPVRHHAEAALFDICEQIELMVAWVDRHMIVRAATPNFPDFMQQPMIGIPLADAIPSLLGIEQELAAIAQGHSPAWRIAGFRLADDHDRLCDLFFVPWSEKGGLYVAARIMSIETSVEQILRQQRNELTLIERRLEMKSAALKTAHDRLVNLDKERKALIDLIATDVRSALSVVHGYAELLDASLRPGGQPAELSALTAIQESVHKVGALIEDVQAIQRVEESLGVMQITSVDLTALMERTYALWQGTAELQGLRLAISIAEDSFYFRGDYDLLAEAVDSLIKCALVQAKRPSTVKLELIARRQWLILRCICEIDMSSQPGSPQQTHTYSRLDTIEIRLARARLVAEGHGGHLTLEAISEGLQSVSIWLPGNPYAKRTTAEEASAPPDEARSLQKDAASRLIVAANGALRIDRRQGNVWVNEQLIKLSPVEFRLLSILAEEAGQVVRHERLLTAIREPGSEASLDTLRVMIWRMRKKLGQSQSGVDYVRTERGYGYSLAD
ncbi:MAG: winged helix-turn-helix domain-containing protein [Caldilineales bacterium]|nr:winged helix-turn-helix domain-containing protein [Caldilineales bacterium]